MRTLCVLFASALAAGPVLSQAKPVPAVEIRVKSVNDLLDRIEYVGGLVGKEDEIKQGTGFVRAISQDFYDVAPEGVVGTLVTYRFDRDADGRPHLVRGSALDANAAYEGEVKVANIQRGLGCRPIFAGG